jgi:hypothetical protein
MPKQPTPVDAAEITLATQRLREHRHSERKAFPLAMPHAENTQCACWFGYRLGRALYYTNQLNFQSILS